MFCFDWICEPVDISKSLDLIMFSKLQSMTLRALATPLRRIRRKPLAIPKEKNRSLWNRLKKERREMGENLSQRFRLCLQGQAQHKRTKSSGQMWIHSLTQMDLLGRLMIHLQKCMLILAFGASHVVYIGWILLSRVRPWMVWSQYPLLISVNLP
jgi:hypothetical protein